MRLSLLTLCLASTAFADQVLVDRVVAIVDSTPLTRSAVEERAQGIELLSRGAMSRELARRDALNELIDELLVARDCERMQLSVDNAEVDAALQSVAEQNQMSMAQLTDEVRKQGL
ncbi:MAG TPA: SurA N-terminal domain-containing protein, partial [Archangium sp.]